MLPVPPTSLETKQTVKMLAILEEWDQESSSLTDNNAKYLLLVLSKCTMDIAVFYACSRNKYKSFLNLCGLSIMLVDVAMLCCMATVWFLGAEKSYVSPCFCLAHASATFAALPLPMMSLGLLDYCLEDTCVNNQRTFCKFLRNLLLTLLVWVLAATCSFNSVSAVPMELINETGISALLCEVKESSFVTCFILVLFSALFFAAPPFLLRIPRWLKEAERLSAAREENDSKKSDLFTSTPCMETKSSEEDYLEETIRQRPPLWFSLMLGFGVFWMPYLFVCVACMVFGYDVPAYISVNLLWLECTNSLLAGLVFWVKSTTQGPYSRLPENVCLWNIYWHLSNEIQQKKLPLAVFNPLKGKRSMYFYV